MNQSEGTGVVLTGNQLANVQLRNKDDGSKVKIKSVTPLNIDNRVGNFFSVNIDGDPNKVQLLFDSFTQVSQQQRNEETTKNTETKQDAANSKS